MWWHGLDLSGSGQGPVAGSYEDGNELSGFIKVLKFVEWQSNCWLVRTPLHGVSKQVYFVETLSNLV